MVLLTYKVSRVFQLFHFLHTHLFVNPRLFLDSLHKNRLIPYRHVFFTLVLPIVFRVLIFSFLFFRLPMNICQFLLIAAVEAVMMEVAFSIIFTNLVKVVHVELNESKDTCLTKDE